jgi:succinate dehydrogenase / fumarate reductase membrane anchor subunit
MVKSVLGVAHLGLRDWVWQRLSAIIMALYVVGLFAYILCHPHLSYADWHGLFSSHWMKVATLLFIISILLHAWVGVWIIFTDYVKSYILRAILEAVVLIGLATSFLWGVMILWGVK